MSKKIHSNPTATVRNLNLDLIRSVAVFLVVSVHFFLNTGFYGLVIENRLSMWAVLIRTGCMACVPLFVMLTGYLCCHKTLHSGYFRRIFPILLSYILCAILTLLFRVTVLKEEISLWKAFLMVLQITNGANSYSWYIEMYIGLYLLIPFLNILYHGLHGKREKQLLLLILCFMTVLPNAVNIFDLLSSNFWWNPTVSTQFNSILPDFWLGLWPLTYYFLGAYLREFECKLPFWKNLLFLIIALVLSSGYNIYRSYYDVFFQPFGSNWGGLQNTVISVLLFQLLLRLDLSRLPGFFQWSIRKIAQLSLCIYLCSKISDTIVYPYINATALGAAEKLPYLPIMVGSSFAIATVLAQIVTWIQQGILWTVRKLS